MSKPGSWIEPRGPVDPRRRGHRTLAGAVIGAMAVMVPVTAAQAKVPVAKKTEAAAMSTIAMKKAGEGRFAVAAEMFHEAFELDPETLGYLYSAARAEQKGGMLAEAETHYRAFLGKAPAGDSMVPNAKKHLQTVVAATAARKAATKAQATPKPEPEPTPVVPVAPHAKPPTASPPAVAATGATDGAWRSMAGWLGVGVGAVGLAAGAYMVSSALADADELKKKLGEGSVEKGEASTMLDAAVGKQNLGYGLLGAGGLGLALGAWWIATAPEERKVSVLIDPNHRMALLSLRF